MHRIAQAFSAMRFKAAAKALSTTTYLACLATLVVLETLLLLIYKLIDNPIVVSTKKIDSFIQLAYTEAQCASSGTLGATLLIGFNVLLMMVLVKLAWDTRNVPSRFNEAKILAVHYANQEHHIYNHMCFNNGSPSYGVLY